jgi:hypothetical protein
MNILLSGLPQIFLVLLGLLLEDLQASLEVLVVGAVVCALVCRSLDLLMLLLKLFNLGLEHRVLVLQRCNLLLLLEVLLLEGLYFGLEFLDLGVSIVGFETEVVHALQGEKNCQSYWGQCGDMSPMIGGRIAVAQSCI